jgi:hypothetical protein
MQRKWLACSFAVLVVLAVCQAAVPATPPKSPLVGRWQRTTTCQEMVAALQQRGLGKLAPAMLAGNGLVEGSVAQLAAKPRICSDATPRVHSHFFDSKGKFGSLDWNGHRVDDGGYRITGSTLDVGGGTFRFRIANNVLTLTPVISAAAKRQALAHPRQFSTAGWQVAVSFPGHSWKRVPCKGWC